MEILPVPTSVGSQGSMTAVVHRRLSLFIRLVLRRAAVVVVIAAHPCIFLTDLHPFYNVVVSEFLGEELAGSSPSCPFCVISECFFVFRLCLAVTCIFALLFFL